MAPLPESRMALVPPWVWPLPALDDWLPSVSQAWRAPDDDDPHLGVDLMYRNPPALVRESGERYSVPDGVAVVAAGAGVVRFAADTRRGGTVIIAHRNGRATYYTHLAALYVKPGDHVEAGQPLGLVGFDPTDAAGVRHLHFEIWQHGTRSTAINPMGFLRAWPMVRHGRGGDSTRNVSWWGIKTPGVILNEMNITNGDVSAIGRDVYATFRRPWEEQFDKARARFKTERGRDPGVGRDAQDADWPTVYGWMDPVPTREDIQWKTYQGAFVHSWGEFERDWGRWYIENKGTGARMWRGTYDQALDYRKKAKAWREKFVALGGVSSSPAPEIPTEGGPLGDIPWKPILLVAGGIAAAVFVVPPLIGAMRRDG